MRQLKATTLAPVRKAALSRADLEGYYASRSTVDVCWNSESESALITLSGELASIPSFKNNRHPRFPGIDRDTLARLKAMDYLFTAANVIPSGFRYTNDTLVFVMFGSRHNGDLDGGLSTILDWLEPPSKRRGPKVITASGEKIRARRGWGIGLIDDDSNAFPFGVRNYAGAGDTAIIIRSFRSISEEFTEFVAGVINKGVADD